MFILVYRFKPPKISIWSSQEILVVGCGNSNLPSDLAQQGFSVVGMDYSKCHGDQLVFGKKYRKNPIFHGKIMENLWFPVDFPFNSSSDQHFKFTIQFPQPLSACAVLGGLVGATGAGQKEVM